MTSLLEGCLKDAEDSLLYEEEDSDLLQDLSPDEASYSLQENLPSDDSCLSLDDLAKRIEIAEVNLRFDISTLKSKMKEAHICQILPCFHKFPVVSNVREKFN